MISSSADKKKTKTKNEHLKTVLFFAPDFVCKIRNGDRDK